VPPLLLRPINALGSYEAQKTPRCIRLSVSTVLTRYVTGTAPALDVAGRNICVSAAFLTRTDIEVVQCSSRLPGLKRNSASSCVCASLSCDRVNTFVRAATRQPLILRFAR
jgi:hypothetical protein